MVETVERVEFVAATGRRDRDMPDANMTVL